MLKKKLILKGLPASAGIAQGKVKVVLDPSECDKVKKGDILVTEITTPRFTPAISKVNAIVTDVGGLLCHAAITAREFKIPCIVATEKATKIMHDGQEVVVDATEGKVYAIK